MAKGELGAKILRQAKYKDVSIGGEVVRVRQLTAMRLFSLQAALGAIEGQDPTKAMLELHVRDPKFLSQIVEEACVEPMTGERVFTEEQAQQLPSDMFNDLLRAVMELAQTPEPDALKA